MADPVSSLAPNNSLDCHLDDDTLPSCAAPVPTPSEATSLACTSEAVADSAPVGAQVLVARFSPPPALPKPAGGGALPVISQTSLSTSSGALAGGGSFRAAATGLNAQIESGALKGSGLELATAHVQYGEDLDVGVTLARQTVALSSHGYGVTVTGDAGVARGNLGENNDDGSIGGNLGIGAEAFGFEVTIDTPAGSLTYGQSASVGASGSMGVRDKDHDGKPEFCAKFSVPAYTVGACLEEFW